MIPWRFTFWLIVGSLIVFVLVNILAMRMGLAAYILLFCIGLGTISGAVFAEAQRDGVSVAAVTRHRADYERASPEQKHAMYAAEKTLIDKLFLIKMIGAACMAVAVLSYWLVT